MACRSSSDFTNNRYAGIVLSLLLVLLSLPTIVEAEDAGLADPIIAILAESAPQRKTHSLKWDFLEAFYSRRAHHAAWMEGQQLSVQGEAWYTALRHVEEDAFASNRFRISEIEALPRMASGPEQAAWLDVLLTDAFYRYAQESIPAAKRAASEHTQDGALQFTQDVVGMLQQALDEHSLTRVLEDLLPQHNAYKQLKTKLAEYRSKQTNDEHWPQVTQGYKLVPGVHDARVSQLRKRLTASGDNSKTDDSVNLKKDNFFDPQLVVAVKAFQRRHGLKDDGIVGNGTLAALNVSLQQRIDQIKSNMVRWRSLPRSLGDRYLMVNVANFSVEAIEDGSPRWSMRAIVGRPDRKTPILSSEVSSIVFNPAWHVPPKLAGLDLLPKQHRDPTFFSRQGIRVFSSWKRDAVEIDPQEVDWSQVSASNFPYKLRQDPGPENSLGHIKFSFENPYGVYLHDTPKRSLFKQPMRALSSGCVRVDDPTKLASYLLTLQENSGWTTEKIKNTIASGRRKTITLAKRVPIYLLYLTAWVDNDGTLNFREDFYEQDKTDGRCEAGLCLTEKTAL